MSSIFHIASAAEWAAAVETGAYRISSRGLSLAEVGFIHCSTAEQLQGVVERFYADDTEPLVVLVIEASAIPDLRVEGGFPHIYGPLEIAWVNEVLPAHLDADGILRY